MILDIVLKHEVDNSYCIHIDALPALHFKGKVAIITNPKVAGLHLAYLLSRLSSDECYIITVPDGEQHKSLQSVEYILERLFEHRLNRKSLLIAFGGGVIGDMGGFAAGIYQRGIDFVQIPTTLLSQVDASVGGKTGINNRFGKNLVGLFHQPKAVYIDPHFLSTLPKREFAAGVAEIIKMAVAFDAAFFEWLEAHELSDTKHLKTAIQKALQIKASVVAKDEKEQGLRAALNYGHTFGHVIENETAYFRYLHGETVAIGMVMANEVACELEMMTPLEAARVKALLERYDLPVTYRIANVDAFYEAFFLDKKSSDRSITFIVPQGIGNIALRDDIDAALIKGVLARYCEA